MARGIGVISGSSTVLFQATDDGAFIIGRDQPVTIQMSGTLNLRIPGVTSGPTNAKWLRVTGSDGYVIASAMSASVVQSVPLGLLTSSQVQDALNELQNHINQVSAGGGSLTFSDGVNSNNLTTNGQTLTITGSTSLVVSTFATNKYTLNLAQNLLLTGNNITVGPLTGNNGFSLTGLAALQTVTLSTLSASANVYAQTMIVTGSTTLGTSGSQVNQTIVNGMFQVPIFTQGNVPPPFVNDPFKYVGYMFYLQGAGSGTFAQGNKWYHNENGIWFPSMFFGA